jgi:DNA-binding NtrC family response regulator
MGKNKLPKIFVVEDDAPMNELICQFLSMQGYIDVKGFYSGEDMLNELNNKEEIIIIQDFDLPGMNGLDILNKVLPSFPKVEFIFLSGQNNIETAVEAIKGGAFDYIVKDKFAKENVQTKISNLLKIKLLYKQKSRMKKAFVYLAFVTFISWIIFILISLN